MFSGFTQEAVDFLTDIRFNNNQTFYEANRERYETYVKAPLRALADEMAPVVQLIDPRLDTRPGHTMSRIRRDTRFTKDKSPFRDHVWLGWRYPGESRSEGSPTSCAICGSVTSSKRNDSVTCVLLGV